MYFMSGSVQTSVGKKFPYSLNFFLFFEFLFIKIIMKVLYGKCFGIHIIFFGNFHGQISITITIYFFRKLLFFLYYFSFIILGKGFFVIFYIFVFQRFPCFSFLYYMFLVFVMLCFA